MEVQEIINPLSNNNSTLKEGEILPPIRLISFAKLKQRSEFPRNPENKDDCVMSDEIDRSKSLLIFLSHCWLRGYPGAPGYEKKPHPDNIYHDKFNLMISAVNALIFSQTKDIKEENIFVWIDFASMNQDEDAAGELKQLKKIVQVCDLMLTPLVDYNHKDWKLMPTKEGFLYDYKAAAWRDGKHAYLNRGWCRTEMLYAANVPVIKNTIDRLSKFKNALAHAASQERRPHFLYGSKELNENKQPICLPPLQHSYLEKYNPIDGDLSYEDDRKKIQMLLTELQPDIEAKKLVIGYVGPVDENGRPHGLGKETLSNGAIYKGNFIKGIKDGIGRYIHVNGATYEGTYSNGLKNGKGKYTYTSGASYDGEWLNGKKHGWAISTDAIGNSFKSFWENGNRFIGYEGDRNDIGERHGVGTEFYVDGSLYDGSWKNDVKNGVAKVIYTNGLVFEGTFVDGVRDGEGSITWPDGTAFTGVFRNDKGDGTISTRWADVYTGEINAAGQMNGRGTRFYDHKRHLLGHWSNDTLLSSVCIAVGHGYIESYFTVFEGPVEFEYCRGKALPVPSDYCKVTYHNGVTYYGYFYEGKMHCCIKNSYQCFYCPSFCWSSLLGSGSKSRTHLDTEDYSECYFDCCFPLVYLLRILELCLYPRNDDAFDDYIFKPEICQHTCYPCSRAIKIEDETYKRTCSTCTGCSTCLISFCFMPVYCKGLQERHIEKEVYFDPFFPCVSSKSLECLQDVCTIPVIPVAIGISLWLSCWVPLTCPISTIVDIFNITQGSSFITSCNDWDDFWEDDSVVKTCVCFGFFNKFNDS